MTIVERVTSYTVSTRINDKSARSVTAATIELLLPFKEQVKTITADNGKEFAYHQEIAAALDASVYFADPYCSWQRSLNENTKHQPIKWLNTPLKKRPNRLCVSELNLPRTHLSSFYPFAYKRVDNL